MKSSLHTFASRVVNLAVVEGYFKVLSFEPIWRYARNYKSVRRYLACPPLLDSVQKRIVNDLREKGLAISHVDELFPEKNMVELLEKHMLQTMKERSLDAKEGKPFLGYLWDKIPIVDLENPFFQLALHERIIAIVDAYMEMYARFYYATLNVTYPVGQDEQKVGSQRWHRDPEDKRLCKMFLYMNDVNEDSGPFTYVPYSTYGKKYGHLFPQRPPIGSYPSARDLERIIPQSAIKKCTGAKGTIIFCDTSGLHFGGYAKSHERIMLTAGYRSCASVMHTGIKFPSQFANILVQEKRSPAVQFAVEANTHTRLTRFMSRRFYELMKSSDMMMG